MSHSGEAAWEETLAARLPCLGHRNWIAVVDAAYPWQVAGGVETFHTGQTQIAVIKRTLAAVDRADHIRPIIYVDGELFYLQEADAPGISAYRTELESLLTNRVIRRLPHEDIISKLDAAGRTFKILVLKTTFLLPYTSIFLELDCGYWGGEAEQRLRNAFPGTAPSS